MPSASRESAAIVIDCRDHGESDKIVTFFTEEHGRLSGIAKGANRSKKRFLNKLELFSFLTVSYSEARHSNLVFITEADLHSAFIRLRSDTSLYNRASIIREFILLSTAEHQGDSAIYNLLLWALQSLDDKKPSLPVVAVFLLRLYNHIGYCPDLKGCSSCSLPLDAGRTHGFDSLSGRLICSNCLHKEEKNSTQLSMGTIRLLQSVLSQPLEKMHRLQFSRQALQQSLTMLHNYGRHLFQREIHSWKTVAGDL